MKREKEMPAELLKYLHMLKIQKNNMFNSQNLFCTIPVRMARMKILKNREHDEAYCNVIVPAVDVYTTDTARLKNGYLRRDSLSYYVAGTKKAFPFGHVYAGNGNLCLGTIFVPSGVPENSVTLPLETLFLHNDRNLSHGQASLYIKKEQSKMVSTLLKRHQIVLSELAQDVTMQTGEINIIKNDQIWKLSADVAEQKALPRALEIMEQVYGIIF